MPFAGFKNWSACELAMLKKHAKESAKKICGKLKAEHEKDFDHNDIVERYNKLKVEHPEYDDRKLLEEVFSNISKDFTEDYPVSSYTKKDGTKVKKHTRGEKTPKSVIDKLQSEKTNIEHQIFDLERKLERLERHQKKEINEYVKQIPPVSLDENVNEYHILHQGEIKKIRGKYFHQFKSIEKEIKEYQEKRQPLYEILGIKTPFYGEILRNRETIKRIKLKNNELQDQITILKGTKVEWLGLEREEEYFDIKEDRDTELILTEVKLEENINEINRLAQKIYTSTKKIIKDFTEDYPVGEHTRQGGKVKVKSHTRGEGKFSELEEKVYKIYNEEKEGRSVFIDTLEEKISSGIKDKNTEIKIIDGQLKFINKKDPEFFNKLWELGEKGKIHFIVGRSTGSHKGYLKFGRYYTKFYITEDDFTEDYPVQAHTRSGKPVKAHTRGENKIIVDPSVKLTPYLKSTIEVLQKQYLTRLPKTFQNSARIEIYNNVTDTLPEMDPESIPISHKEVGWEQKKKDISGYYDRENDRVLLKIETANMENVMLHEIGHAVFEKVLITEERVEINRYWNIIRKDLLEINTKVSFYQANDVREYFAVTFERFYGDYKEPPTDNITDKYKALGINFSGSYRKMLELEAVYADDESKRNMINVFEQAVDKEMMEKFASLGLLKKDFAFPETMQRTILKVKKCKDCKKEVDSYFYESKKNKKIKLCEECYLKRVKNYVEKYDFNKDLKFERKETDWGDEVLVDIKLLVDGKNVGGISYTYVKEESELEKPLYDTQIENFDIKPEFQGKGYGSLILKEVLKEIDKKGWSVELGATFTKNVKGLNRENLISFYQRYGFRLPTEEDKKRMSELGFSPEDPLGQVTMFREKSGKGKGWHGDPERHSKARKFGKADTFDTILLDIAIELEHDLTNTLTEDVGRVGRPRLRGLKAGTPGAMISGAKRTKVGQSLIKQLGKEVFQVVSPESITVPFSITNTETGRTMTGEVIRNLEENTKQMMPVSSSNVRAVGQFKNELLVQFHPKGLTPLRTYRYMFETSEQAEEALTSITGSGSPGKWVWQSLRGHAEGEPLPPSKFGPSLSPPGLGIPTIGGTSASIVPYKISNRVPVSKVRNFEEVLREMKRSTPNPVADPLIGTRIEALLGARKELRELNVKGFRKGTGGLPPIGDFVYVGNIKDLTEDKWVTIRGRHVWIKENYNPEEFFEASGGFHELSPWLMINKNIDVKKNYGIILLNDALDDLPLKIKNMIKEIRIYKGGVAEDPYFVGRSDEIPQAYKNIGLERTWKDTGGVYISNKNIAIMGKAEERFASTLINTMRHEVGHAVWYKLSIRDRADFINLYYKNKDKVRKIWGDYEANDAQELYAESFARYWKAKSFKQKGKQRQLIGDISRFFNTKMQKYFKEE